MESRARIQSRDLLSCRQVYAALFQSLKLLTDIANFKRRQCLVEMIRPDISHKSRDALIQVLLVSVLAIEEDKFLAQLLKSLDRVHARILHRQWLFSLGI
jgi:hypothetical protein